MTIFCRTCSHPRLVHDSWGCKTKCGCGVSIIYLTPGPLDTKSTPEEDQVEIEEGNLFDRSTDRLEESRLRAIYDRAIAERSTENREGGVHGDEQS